MARNTAIEISTGEAIANLDADDAYEPNRLPELVPLAMEYGAAIDNTGVYNTDLYEISKRMLQILYPPKSPVRKGDLPTDRLPPNVRGVGGGFYWVQIFSDFI